MRAYTRICAHIRVFARLYAYMHAKSMNKINKSHFEPGFPQFSATHRGNKYETNEKDEKGEKGESGGREENVKSDEGILIVKGQLGREVQFKIQKSTPLRKRMDAYCSRFGMHASQMRFLVDGVPSCVAAAKLLVQKVSQTHMCV